jgi:outer membrane protein TolC
MSGVLRPYKCWFMTAVLSGIAAVAALGADDAQYPIDLPAVLRLAGAQNLDIRLAETSLAEARANRSTALEKFFPSLTPALVQTSHDGNIQAVDGTILDVDKRSYTQGLTLAAQVPLGEAIFGALQSRQLMNAASAGLSVQQQDSILAAVQEYFELVRAGAQIGVVRDALEASGSYERQLGEAVRIGIAFRGDELRVRTQTQRLQIELEQASETQHVAAARLVRTLHLDPLVHLQASENEPLVLALPAPAGETATLIASAYANRPELARSRAVQASAREARRAAVYGPLIPSIGAQVFGGELGRTAGTANSSRDTVLGLSWRIGPGGLLDVGRIGASNARFDAARFADEKLRDEIARQVVEAQARVDSTRQQTALARTGLDSAADTLRLTRERKQLGVGTVLEDIQAQQEVVRSRTQYLSAVTEFNKAQYALQRAVGAPLLP